jgi:MYXO-CTERM domain-containing protein
MNFSKLASVALSFGLLLAAQASQAVVLDFESLATGGTSLNNVADGYAEDGFKFLNLTIPNAADSFGVWQTGSGAHPGSTALFNQWQDAITQLTQIGGVAFNASSIQLASLNLSPLPNTVTFVGTRADNSTVTQAITMVNPSVLSTYSFVGMNNLVKLEWSQAVPFHQFDNINVSSVPEPASLAVVGLGVLALIRRRRAGK